jgi:hypothetical protein
MIDDQVTRLDTKTGTIVQYLFPRRTNIRRVHVDNSTTPVTFWSAPTTALDRRGSSRSTE